MVHVEWNSGHKAAFTPVVVDLKFPTRPPENGAEALYHKLVTKSLSTLTHATHTPTDDVLQLLRTIVSRRDIHKHAGRDAEVQWVRHVVAVEDDDETF